MTITETVPSGAVSTGTVPAQRYAVPTIVTNPPAVPLEPAEPRPWFTVPTGDMVTAADGSMSCALCAGTGVLPDGSACPGTAEPQTGRPVAWYAVEVEFQPGAWTVTTEGIAYLKVDSDQTVPAGRTGRTWLQVQLDGLVQQLAGDERNGFRRHWIRISATAPAGDERAVIAYDEVPPQAFGHQPARGRHDNGGYRA